MYSCIHRKGSDALENSVGGRNFYHLICGKTSHHSILLSTCYDNRHIYLIYILQGIISSGLVIVLQTWCIQKGGPVFVSSFQPVQTVLVAGMASIVLGDQLYSGGYVLNLNVKIFQVKGKR